MGLTMSAYVRQDIAMRPDGTFDTEAYAQVVADAERFGYDHVLVPDHVFVPPYMARLITDLWLEPLALLSFLAARTTRIELVTSCLVVPYRQPLAVAKMVATIDQLSGGRFALGIVPGYMKEEFAAFGLPVEERSAMTDEFMRIMIELWTKDVATYQGDYYSFGDIQLTPKCVRSPHVPIWVGGSSRGAIRRLAEFGDVWNPLGFTVVNDAYKADNADELAGKPLPTSGTLPDDLRRGIELATQLAEKAGRDLSGVQVVVNPGLPPDEGTDTKQPQEAQDTIRGGQRIVDWLGQYVEAGATGFVVSPPGATLEECSDLLEHFATEVAPQLAVN